MSTVLHKALAHYGLTEVPGKNHNPKILEFFRVIGHSWVKNDELAWCAAFINYCLKTTGHAHTGKLNARSFLGLQNAILFPELGDIVILWRGSKMGPYGHVGLYINEDNTHFYLLGGNQSNQVNISRYPKNRLLGIRRPQKI